MIGTVEFKQEVKAWAEEIGVEPKDVHMRSMRRKLASCSSKGRLTFDASLLEAPQKVRDEAVVHELLHLKYPNHGKMFKLLLGEYLKVGK